MQTDLLLCLSKDLLRSSGYEASGPVNDLFSAALLSVRAEYLLGRRDDVIIVGAGNRREWKSPCEMFGDCGNVESGGGSNV